MQNNFLKQFDRFFLLTIFGSVLPIAFFVVIMLFTILFLPGINPFKNGLIPFYGITALVLGVLINVLCRKYLTLINFDHPFPVLIAVFLFYNIGMYGLFMGFPVFHLFLGLIAGYYFNRRIAILKPANSAHIKKRVSFFASLIMAFFCISTALIVITHSNTTVFDVNLMAHRIGIRHVLNIYHIYFITVLGAIILIFAQFYLTRFIISLRLQTTR